MDKSFKDLYTEIYSKNSTKLEDLRKPKNELNKMHVLQVLFLIIISIFSIPIAAVLFVFCLAINIYITSKQTDDKTLVERTQEYNNRYEKYKKSFKENVIGPLISNVFEEASYNINSGINRVEYKEANFKENVDYYETEDLITVKIKGDDGLSTNIRFAEVHTQKEYTDIRGNKGYSTVFCGLVGIVDLNKNINNKIYIKMNSNVSNYSNNNVEMDMTKFENVFDVEATDKILALRILTSEIMTEMIDLYNKYKYKFEIHIINNKIYMRIATGEVFEPNMFKHSLEYETIEKCYLILQALINTSTCIYNAVNSIEL